MTEKETVTAREDQPRLTPAEWNGITNRLVELSQAMQKAGEAQGEAPQVGTCDFSKVPHERHKFCNEFAESGHSGGQTIGQNTGKFLNSAELAMTNERTKEGTTGAHPSQDARSEFLTGILAKYGVDCGPSIATHGGRLIYGDEFMHAADEIINWARSTPSLPAQDAPLEHVRKELEGARLCLAIREKEAAQFIADAAKDESEIQFLQGQLRRLSEDFQSWLKKYESGELAGGSTPSPDPPKES